MTLQRTKVLATVLLLTAVTFISAGCTPASAKEQFIISSHRGNVEAMNTFVQADEEVPEYLKLWMDAEVDSWRSLEAWSRGEAPLNGSDEGDE